MNKNGNMIVGDSGLSTEEFSEEPENLWKLAMESVGDSMWDWHISEKKLVFSSPWKERLGYAQNEIGEAVDEWERLVHPDDLASCHRDFERYLSGETPIYRNEHRIRAKDGSYRWFLDRGKVVARGDGGEPLRAIGTYTEITDRKLLEQELAVKEAQYHAVVDTAVDGIIVIDAGGIIQSLNPAAERIFGYRAEEVIGRTINSLMPEPYRSKHDHYLKRYMETGQAYIVGYRREVVGLRKDGTTFSMSLAVSQMMIGGQPYFTGILRDITKSKRSETTRQMMNAIYSDSAILITDADNQIITVNKPFTRITGYELHEVIGRNPNILSSGRHDKAFYEKMWHSLNTTGHWQGKLWNRRKNGQEYLESLSISLIYDDNGEVFRHVAMFSGIAADLDPEQYLDK
jgi:PAS domain S-box-containing protein